MQAKGYVYPEQKEHVRDIESSAEEASSMEIARASKLLGWLLLPVALLVVATIVLHALGVSTGRESAVLLTAFNVLFCSAAGLVVAFLGGRGYLQSGSRSVLLLGAGGLVFALAYFVAGPLITAPNDGITVHNSSMLLAGLLLAASAISALSQRSHGIVPHSLVWRLVSLYAAGVLAVAALIVATLTGLTFDFYVVGEGMTMARHTVLGVAVAGLVASAALFVVAMRRSASRMHAYVAAGLLAFGVSLAALALTQATPGSPIVWLGRAGQWLGGSYLLVGLFTLDRSTGEWAASLESALGAVEERYQKLVELSPYGIVVQSDGLCVFANPALVDILGARDKNELIGRSILDWVAPDHRGHMGNCLDPRRAESAGPPHEIEMMRSDGSVVIAEVVCTVIEFGGRLGVQVIVRDVTTRRQAEAAVHESEERFRTLVESAPAAIFIQTGGKFVYLNHMAEELFGVERADSLLGSPVLDWLHPASRAAVRERIRLLNEEQRAAPMIEETILRADDTPVDVEVLAVPFSYGGEEGALVFMTDVTERKKAEEALARSEEELRQSQKMEAVGQLAGGVAHDFNNLLTAIVGYSDLVLARGDEVDHDAKADVTEIRRAAERAAALTKQILAFSRKQALRPEVVCLNDIVVDMEPLLRRTLGEDIDLLTLKYPDLGLTEIDTLQFGQVLINLAVNARDAMPHGGRLTLETANVDIDEEYCRSHPDAAAGSCVMLGVSDTGIGMDADTKSHIFEPFFTTKALGAGTGLGLSTVYGIVRQSGGSIYVYSEPGRGTSFKIYLSRVSAKTGAAQVHAPIESRPAGGERILVVEDEAALRNLIARILSDVGYEVLSAGSGDEALQIVSDLTRPPDLLLTDVVLPGGMQGNHLARELSSRWPEVPVLYMSGYTRNAIVHSGRLDEGVNFLEKPFAPDVLTGKVGEILGRSGS